ncbi:MAG: DUF1080 domain-containing protein [Verrucomicrobiota bacterium]
MKIKLTLAALLALPVFVQADDGFKSIFDGKTLEGWDGKAPFWSVEDGAITGETTKENPTKGNTFVIWKGGTVKDFELIFEYRFLSDRGNSGCQYRSKDHGNHVVGGYQADFEAGTRFSGILYGERTGRGIMTDRGLKNVLGDGKTKKSTEKFADRNELQKSIKGKGEWNKFHVYAKGSQLIHTINGQKMSETIDESTKDFVAEGILAFQLHAGPPMKIQFRNVKIKTL